MSERRDATLGELFTLDNAKLGVHAAEPTVMSLSKYDGFVRADDYFDKRIASKSLDGYKVVEPGEWAFSTIHIDEGSIARNNLGERGVISPMYTTMRWSGGDNVPEYAELLVKASFMVSEYTARAQGSVNRRRSLPFKAFAEIPFRLPTPDEQRRVVAIVRAVDKSIEALAAEVSSLSRLYEGLLGHLQEAFEPCPLAGLVERAFSGGTPSRERDDFFGGDIPWLKSGEVDNDFIATSSEFITEKGLAGSSAKMVPVGATVVAMYGQGETKGKAGYVAQPVSTNQAVLALLPKQDRVHPRFLLHAVRSQTQALRNRAVGAAQPNLSKGLILSHEVPAGGDLKDQERFAAAADGIRGLSTATDAECRRLRALREALVGALLRQATALNEAVDQFIQVDGEAMA